MRPFCSRIRQGNSLCCSAARSEGKPFILATTTGRRTGRSGGAARNLHALHVLAPSLPVVFPVHPRTRQLTINTGIPLQVPYGPSYRLPDMRPWVQGCRHVITDSGGLSGKLSFSQASIMSCQHPFWPKFSGLVLYAGGCDSLISWKNPGLENNSTHSKLSVRRWPCSEKISDILLASWQGGINEPFYAEGIGEPV